MQIDKDETYQTSDGHEVRIYAVDSVGEYPVHGAIKNKNGQWYINCWTATGMYASGVAGNSDLVLVPKRHTREVWINMYHLGLFAAYESEELARASQAPGCIACKHLTFEFVEGEGL